MREGLLLQRRPLELFLAKLGRQRVDVVRLQAAAPEQTGGDGHAGNGQGEQRGSEIRAVGDGGGRGT